MAIAVEAFEPLQRLDADLKQASAKLTGDEARYLVDLYYAVQRDRVRSAQRLRESTLGDEPNRVVEFFFEQTRMLENDIRRALDAYSSNSTVGAWSKTVHGVGPVIAAGLLAHVDISFSKSVSKLWRFAGLDPTVQWLGQKGAREAVANHLPENPKRKKGAALKYGEVGVVAFAVNRNPQAIWKMAREKDGKATVTSLESTLAKRPWNARLKVLCWKIGKSFVLSHSHPDCFYGHIYSDRKLRETEMNSAGLFREQAEEKLAETKIGRDTETFKWYEQGMLPPGRIELRAQRYAVKLFLSHWWEVAYIEKHGVTPPLPWIIQHGGHTDLIPVPNSPFSGDE